MAFAIQLHDTYIPAFFLDNGFIKIEDCVSDGYASLAYALQWGAPYNLIEMFLQRGANTNAVCKSMTPLCFAALHHDNVRVMTLLVNHKAELEPNEILSPLYFAVKEGCVNNVTYLIKAGADVNADLQFGPRFRRARGDDRQDPSILMFAIDKLLIFQSSARQDIVKELIFGNASTSGMTDWRSSQYSPKDDNRESVIITNNHDTQWDWVFVQQRLKACIPILK